MPSPVSNWTRSSVSPTVTIDTRGISAGTADGRAALTAASDITRYSDSMGRSASPGAASAFNDRARSVANYVSGVAASHRAASSARAASDSYVRNLVASRVRR